MARLAIYDINAKATQISKEFYIQDNREEDKSYILQDELRLQALDLKARVQFVSRPRL